MQTTITIINTLTTRTSTVFVETGGNEIKVWMGQWEGRKGRRVKNERNDYPLF
jgi:hypothetical protein